MKIVDFRFLDSVKESQHSRPVDFAVVTVETGFLFWKEVEQRHIYRDLDCWKYLGNGDFCERAVEKFADAANAKQLLDKCKVKQ